jgi:hypothetical protein
MNLELGWLTLSSAEIYAALAGAVSPEAFCTIAGAPFAGSGRLNLTEPGLICPDSQAAINEATTR